jgi:transposase
LDAYLDGLNLESLEVLYDGVGSEAYRPDLMLKLVVLEVLEGRRSPAQWARDARENLALLWIGRGIQPSRTAMYDFRDRIGDALLEINAEAVRQAMEEGLVDPDEGVLDGTAIRAYASRHRLLNQSVLQRRRAELQTALEQDAVGRSLETPPAWMAKTCVGRMEQAQRYAKAQEALTGRLAENAKRPKEKRLDEKKVLVSASDPEAPLGRDKEKVFGPLYTAQVVVEPASCVVLSFDVFAQPTDAGTLGPMLDRTEQVIGRHLDCVTVDAGYVSLLDLQECEQRGVVLFGPLQENDFTAKNRARRGDDRIRKEAFTWLDEEQTYRCPQGHRLDYQGKQRKRRRGERHVVERRFHCAPRHCCACPLRQRCVRNPGTGRTVKRFEGEELVDAHRQRMTTPEAQRRKRLRGQTIERCFADAKAHRNSRRLTSRGLQRARTEVGLVMLAQNAMTVARLRQTLAKPGEDNS